MKYLWVWFLFFFKLFHRILLRFFFPR